MNFAPAGRLALERQRLALLQVRSAEEMEQQFWEWTKRPDVQAELYPHRGPDQLRRGVDRMSSSRLLGIHYPCDDPNNAPDPPPSSDRTAK